MIGNRDNHWAAHDLIVGRSSGVLKLVVACRCGSGPGSCQEARWQAGSVGGKRPASKPSVEALAGGATERSVA